MSENVIVTAELEPVKDKIISDNFEKIKNQRPGLTIEKFRGDLMGLGMSTIIEQVIRQSQVSDPIMNDPKLEEFRKKCGL